MAKCAKSKVCKVSNSDKLILTFLYENREGIRVKTLQKLTNLKQRTLYKRLNILRKNNLVENIFPIWKIPNGGVAKCSILIKSDNIFELHNISYIVKLLKIPDWWNKRKNYLIRLKEWQFKEVNFGKNNSNPYVQLLNENFIIQCYPESLIIIARKRYYSNNPYEVSVKAISDVLDLLEWFCERFRFDFFSNGIPHLEVRNNDFNRLNDYLANKIKQEKGKFLIELDKRRKVWVDMSEPFGKEANYPEAQEILEKVTKDHLLNKPLLNSELQGFVGESFKQIQMITENQQVFDKNIQLHQSVLEDIKNAVNELTKEIKKLNEN